MIGLTQPPWEYPVPKWVLEGTSPKWLIEDDYLCFSPFPIGPEEKKPKPTNFPDPLITEILKKHLAVIEAEKEREELQRLLLKYGLPS